MRTWICGLSIVLACSLALNLSGEDSETHAPRATRLMDVFQVGSIVLCGNNSSADLSYTLVLTDAAKDTTIDEYRKNNPGKSPVSVFLVTAVGDDFIGIQSDDDARLIPVTSINSVRLDKGATIFDLVPCLNKVHVR